MAQPIPLNLPARDPRAELQARLQNAPQEHAEALLAAYEVLQGLHDRGVFDLLRGALGSSDKVLEIVVEAAKTPESIRGIRNVMILTKLFAGLDPELLEHIADAVPKALAEAKTQKPLGLLQLMGKATNADTRRTMTILLKVAESLGKDLSAPTSQ